MLASANLIEPIHVANEIARVIHLTYPDKHSIPVELARNVDCIRSNNPDYETVVYDDQDIEDFIEREFGTKILETYRRIESCYGASRADLFRYLCVYRLGGVYLDIKCKVTRPLKTSIRPEDRYILSQWNSEIEGGRFANWGNHKGLEHVQGGEFQQWHVIACAGHPFLKAVIESVLQRIGSYSPFRLGVGRNAVVRTTGPIAYTQAIFPILHVHPHRIVSIETDLGIHYSIYDRNEGAKHAQHFKRHYASQIKPLIAGNPITDKLFYLTKWANVRLRDIGSKLKRT